MTLSVASYSAESFEDRVSDVVESPSYLLSPIYETALLLFEKQLLLQASLSPLRN